MVQRSSFPSKPYAEVLHRVFDLPGTGMSKPLAESLIALDFPAEDTERIEMLSEKANEGQLTPDEESELDAYVNIGDLLAYWQSKARQFLHSSE